MQSLVPNSNKEALVLAQEIAGTLPSFVQRFVKTYTEVKKDGHCGYRALRVSLGWNERSWRDSKRMLLEHWLKNQKYFLEIIGSEPNDTAKFDQITKGLQNLTIPCKKDCYMTMPYAGIFIQTVLPLSSTTLNFIITVGYLIADYYKRPFVVYSTNSHTYLPRCGPSSDASENTPIFLVLQSFADEKDNHFFHLSMKDNASIPPLTPDDKHHRPSNLTED